MFPEARASNVYSLGSRYLFFARGCGWGVVGGLCHRRLLIRSRRTWLAGCGPSVLLCCTPTSITTSPRLFTLTGPLINHCTEARLSVSLPQTPAEQLRFRRVWNDGRRRCHGADCAPYPDMLSLSAKLLLISHLSCKLGAGLEADVVSSFLTKREKSDAQSSTNKRACRSTLDSCLLLPLLHWSSLSLCRTSAAHQPMQLDAVLTDSLRYWQGFSLAEARAGRICPDVAH